MEVEKYVFFNHMFKPFVGKIPGSHNSNGLSSHHDKGWGL
jgi:hypothetical protein